MESDWRVYEDEGLRISHPPEWRVITQMRGCRVMFLTAGGSSDFRSSLTITEEPAPVEGLDRLLEGLLPTLDRYFTDYVAHEVEDVVISSFDGKVVRGRYRQGRVAVALDQWMVPTDDRLFAISASYDSEQDGEFFDLASRAVTSLEFLVEQDPRHPDRNDDQSSG